MHSEDWGSVWALDLATRHLLPPFKNYLRVTSRSQGTLHGQKSWDFWPRRPAKTSTATTATTGQAWLKIGGDPRHQRSRMPRCRAPGLFLTKIGGGKGPSILKDLGCDGRGPSKPSKAKNQKIEKGTPRKFPPVLSSALTVR